ncbi:hypothetical protein MVES1_001004 [Malassezia vespertilionis]|uniref:uncharacterized protein n=1 Tax=Malassezia vespertilionis TaxID=2020962 RepID=UPI0024B275CB|nr:uncharacterized protein MVES1_001004 [Malassezia vespertilionis]WFD05672.1 hypothetical protein MVES1_001004 [Malassezia vespertilionis]
MLQGKTAFISTGASRGIGAEVAKTLAARGANVVIAAKSAEPHKILPGTIHSVADEVHAIADKHQNGAKALPIQMDVRDDRAVKDAIAKAVGTFGNLDILVNNASAINLGTTVDAKPKNYDLVNNINARGTWLVSRYALEHLYQSASAGRNPHIVTLSPPLNQGLFARRDDKMDASFAQTRALYAMSKCAMSVAAYALAGEALPRGVASNTIWPYTLIGTSAMRVVNPGEGAERGWRSPAIVSDAAVRLVQEDAKEWTGRFLIDELYLRERHGFTTEQMAAYSIAGPDTPFSDLSEDLFITQEVREAVRAYYS